MVVRTMTSVEVLTVTHEERGAEIHGFESFSRELKLQNHMV